MKILVLGANGQVGHELRSALASLGDVVVATRDGKLADGSECLAADLADPASLASALDRARAHLVVNAAAYTAVDRAEDEPEFADRVNHRAVGEIGAWAAAHGARVIHYSTDYVFDGSGTRPYREDDPTSPLGAYGRSKLAGEHALAASGVRHLILRTAWVYAARGHNFLRTMLRLARERDELRIVADQVGAPTPAHWLADATAAIAARWSGTDEDGVCHLAAAGQCSWHAFAQAIVGGALQRGLIERAPRVTAIASTDFPTRARRPAYSVLDGHRVERTFDIVRPDWRIGLDEVLAQMPLP